MQFACGSMPAFSPLLTVEKRMEVNLQETRII
jgi:hypothetical protein